MTKINMIYLLTFFISSSLVAQQLTPKEQKKEQNQFKEATYMFHAQKYEESLKKLNKEKHPFLASIAYFRTKDYSSALHYLNKINLEKQAIIKDEVLYYKAYTLYKLKKYKESLQVFNQMGTGFVLTKEKDILFLKLALKVPVDLKTLKKVIKSYKDLSIRLSSDMELAIFILKNNLKHFNQKKSAVQTIKSILVKNPNRSVRQEIRKVQKAYKLKIQLSTKEKVQKCSHLVKLHQNKEGNQCFDQFIHQIKAKNTPVYCDAHYYHGAALKKRRHHKNAIKEFNKVLKTCKNYAFLDKTNYLAGLSSLMRKEYKNAIKYFQTLYKKYPKSNLADDGINYIGFIYSEQKKYKQAEKIYLKQIKHFTSGDTTQDAIWKMAYNYYKQKKYKKYIKFVENKNFKENKYYSKGRLEYWLAKTYEAIKQPKRAQDTYKKIIDKYNNNFYAYMARMKYKKKIKQKPIINTPVSIDGFKTYLKEQKKWSKVNWFIKNGLTEFLIYELNALNKKDNIYQNHKKEISIFLIDAGIYHLPFWHAKLNQKWKSYDLPFEEHVAYLKKLYPKAYELYIMKYAKMRKISPYLILSIMREESYFHSSIESWANAYGLMQIIEPTAKNLAKNLKIPYKRQLLFNPEYNIKLGSSYLKWSSNYFKRKLYYIIPSYNAGLTAVKRWKKLKYDKKTKDYDMFIEDISYTETRHYTKRVLNTYFNYLRLYEGKFIRF